MIGFILFPITIIRSEADYVSVCIHMWGVCVCVFACVRVCVSACVRTCARECVYIYIYIYIYIYNYIYIYIYMNVNEDQSKITCAVDWAIVIL